MRNGNDMMRAKDVELELQKERELTETALNRVLEHLTEQYATKRQVVGAINRALEVHHARHHMPWYRRLIAWCVAPLAGQAPDPALEAAAQQQRELDFKQAAKAVVENAIAESNVLADPAPIAGQVRKRHTADADGTEECAACGEYHVPEELEIIERSELNTPVREEYDPPAPPAPEFQTVDNGVKFRDKRARRAD